jgi:DNA replication protein DnaC
MQPTDRLEHHLKMLSLHTMRQSYRTEVDNALKAKLSYEEFLARLAEMEVLAHIDRSINRRIQVAGFPMIKRLDEFDFTFQPQLDEHLIRSLATLHFLDEAANILLLGPPGVGKTHLAIALGIIACQQRKHVIFLSAEELTHQLAAADVAGSLPRFLQTLARADLLIIDELGYLELSKNTASLFFQLITKRYEKGSIIVTSNKPFEHWGQIFQDDILASAILDRLLHHCHPFFIQGKSFRMKALLTPEVP